MSPHLTICGVHELRYVLERRRPDFPITHIVSLWDPPADKEGEEKIAKQHDLFDRTLPKPMVMTLYFDDIKGSIPGKVEPGLAHMREVLVFARDAITECGPDTHLLVHCKMGISRSTACALGILALANPGMPAQRLLDELVRTRECSVPNPRLTQFADQLLQRDDPLLPAVLAHKEKLGFG